MRQPNFDARILIVDDESANINLLMMILRVAGYKNTVATTDPRDVEPFTKEIEFDLILLDLNMPELDGFQVLQQIKDTEPGYLPVVVLTALNDPKNCAKAFQLGAMDFVTKPFDQVEVLNRIANLLETRKLYLDQQRYNKELETVVANRTQELQQANDALVDEVRERKKAEEGYKNLIESTPDPILLLNPNRIFFANVSALALLGVDGNLSVADLHLDDYVHPNDQEKFGALIDRVAQDSSCCSSEEILLLTDKGVPVDTSVVASSAYIDGTKAIQVVIRDIRDQKRHQIASWGALLSRRERQVMNLLVTAETNKVIAQHLKISERTVEKHRSRILEKMHAKSMADLVRKAPFA